VQIEYPGDPKYSFSITNKGNWDFELKSLANDSVVVDYDTTALRVYLTGFKNIQFEGFEQGKDKAFIDSIFNATPVHKFRLETLDGEISRMEAFLKKAEEGRLDMYGEPMLYDPDRLYARINGGADLVTIQFYVFDNIIFGLPNFLKGEEK